MRIVILGLRLDQRWQIPILEKAGRKYLAARQSWPFVERRREAQPAGVVILGDRRGLVDLPAPTRGLLLTILVCVGLVLGFALTCAALGQPAALLTLPAFVAYLYVILFSKTLFTRLKLLWQA